MSRATLKPEEEERPSRTLQVSPEFAEPSQAPSESGFLSDRFQVEMGNAAVAQAMTRGKKTGVDVVSSVHRPEMGNAAISRSAVSTAVSSEMISSDVDDGAMSKSPTFAETNRSSTVGIPVHKGSVARATSSLKDSPVPGFDTRFSSRPIGSTSHPRGATTTKREAAVEGNRSIGQSDDFPNANALDADPAEKSDAEPMTTSAQAAVSGGPLAPATRARMEKAFDHDFSHVRIHTDGRAASAGAELDAHAFTVGRDISFGAGEYAPDTPGGDRLLAHELTHVVQQDEGRMPSGGVLSPKHKLEQEAYTTERRIVATLPSIDEELGTRNAPNGNSSRYQGEPPLARGTDEPLAGESERGPNTSEAALTGPLPSARDARPEAAASVQDPQVLSPAVDSPNAGLPSSMPAESGPSATNAALSPSETSGAGNQVLPPMEAEAAATGESPSGLVQAPVPTLRDPAAWLDALAREGALRLEALQTSSSASIQRIRDCAQRSVSEARSAFDSARARFVEAAQAGRDAIETFHKNGTQKISTEMSALTGELDSHFAGRSDDVRGAADDARALIAQTVEAEANRSRSESEARSRRARRHSESSATTEGPLAEGQREIASRVANEIAEQCLQTGEDAAVEVRKAEASRSAGIDANLGEVLQTLETAREAAHAKLAQSGTEALAVLDEQAAQTSEEVEARSAEGIAALDQQEEALGSWIFAQSEQECAELTTRAETSRAALVANIESLTTSFNDAAVQAEPLFSDESAEEPDIAQARLAFDEVMTDAWTTHVAPQLAEGDQLIKSFEEHANSVGQGLLSVLGDARATLEQSTTETTAGLAMLGERFGSFVEQAGERTLKAVRDGVSGTCAEADRAVAEHASVVTAEAQQSVQAIQSAVDQQLAWEDRQIESAAEKIEGGQTQAAQQFRSLEEQARARDSAGESAAVARGWMGDLWGWFSDLADSTLEWFQEKLGEVWGTIIGRILQALIYVVGVIVSGVAWVGAQVINLVWGFIWGETAIPGYGGGVFAFIGDLIAGILVYGDVRDLVKYLIVRPLMGEGPWWFNLLMAAIAVIGLIPLFGDLGKSIVKALLKGGVKAAAKRLIKALGKTLAERLIKEVGEEIAEDLLEKLGKEALQKMAGEMTGTVIKELVEKLGERTIKKLLEELSGAAVKQIEKDLSKETIEKLLRTLGGNTIKELNEKLGAQALEKLLTGLRGATIKEYLDLLGDNVLKKLAKDLDGYAVKSLVDDLGERVLKDLAAELDGAVIKRLTDDLGAAAMKELAGSIGAKEIRTLVETFGHQGLNDLVAEIGVQGIKDIGVKGLKELAGHLNPKEIGEWLLDLGSAELRRLANLYGGEALKHYGRNWFKAYKGVTGQTQHHLLVGEFTAAGGFKSGCHDKTAFEAVVAAGKVVLDTSQTSFIGIYTKYIWRKPAGTSFSKKTVVDGLAADWAKWADEIKDATDKLIRAKKFPTDTGKIPESSMAGANWWGYFRNGEIASFFPEI